MSSQTIIIWAVPLGSGARAAPNPKGRVIPCAECETPEICRDQLDKCGKFGEEHIYRKKE